jgi:hypothetical protein
MVSLPRPRALPAAPSAARAATKRSCAALSAVRPGIHLRRVELYSFLAAPEFTIGRVDRFHGVGVPLD